MVLLIAKMFGAGSETDAYMVAKSIPLLFILFGDNVLALTFVPVFMNRIQNAGETQAWVLAGSFCGFLIIFLAIVSALIGIFAPEITSILAPGFGEDTHSTATLLIRIMSPAVILAGMSGTLACIFYSYKHFTIPAVTSLFSPLGMLFGLLLFAGKVGMISIALGTIAGLAIQSLVLFILISKKRQFRLNFQWKNSGVKEILELGSMRFLCICFNQINLLVDRAFASALGSGYVSALTFSANIIHIPLILFGSSVGKTLMPHVTRMVSDGDTEKLRNFFTQFVRMIFFVMIPVSFLFVFFGDHVVRIFLKRGAFDEHAVKMTSFALVFYGVGLVFSPMNALLTVFFYALKKDVRTHMKIGMASCCMNVVLDAILVKILAQGGLALATSLVGIFGTVMGIWLLTKKIGFIALRETLYALLKIGIATSLTTVLIWLGIEYIGSRNLWNNEYIAFVTTLCVGIVLFGGSCYVFRVGEMREIMQFLGRRFGNSNG